VRPVYSLTHSETRSPLLSRHIRTRQSSVECEATDTVGILTTSLRLGYETHLDLGENDRSCTGYPPRAIDE
jgi:hypothetical protein